LAQAGCIRLDFDGFKLFDGRARLLDQRGQRLVRADGVIDFDTRTLEHEFVSGHGFPPSQRQASLHLRKKYGYAQRVDVMWLTNTAGN
jgi:hypothetical protein